MLFTQRRHQRLSCSLPLTATNIPNSTKPQQQDRHDTVRKQIKALVSNLSVSSNSSVSRINHPAKVYIIGTGLSSNIIDLPLSTLAILTHADVVLYDALSLSPDEILSIVPPSCLLVNVGKRGDDKRSKTQSEIDSLLLHYATSNLGNDDEGKKKTRSGSSGPTIVRLKGGDPFVFGRTRSEIDTLRQEAISYRVIPNLSSCVAGPHVAGIPLTDPVLGVSSFAVFSGTNAAGVGLSQERDGKNWESLDVDTLVFLMMGRLDKLEDFCSALVEQGGARWRRDTCCAVVRNAGSKGQQVWRATLGDLVDIIRMDLGEGATTVSPAILVVGQTASLDLLAQ